MNTPRKSVQRMASSLAIFLLPFFSVSQAFAAVATLPAVQLTVNGTPAELESSLSFFDDDGFWVSQFQGAGVGWLVTDGIAAFSTDPFIDYSFSVKNFTDSTLSFTVSLSTPFVGGPYNVLTTDHWSTVEDGDIRPDGKVTIGTSVFSFIHNPQIDGSVIPGSQISGGCSLIGSPAFSGPCQAQGNPVIVSTSTGKTGTLAIVLAFTLSPHDSYSAFGSADISFVPEPATYAQLLAGIVLLLLLGARRRIL
jgi:hypothetical protein